MQSKPIRRDAIYARYSSHAQDGGTSIEVQLEACEAAILRLHPLTPPPPHPLTYVDRATTGRSLARPALRQLIDDAEAGKIGRVCVYKYDRLGRSGGTHLLIEDLEGLGVEVLSATEGENALARGVQLVVAQDYSRVLAERTSAGLVQRHREGRWTGGLPPYGYRIVEEVDQPIAHCPLPIAGGGPNSGGGGGGKRLEVDPEKAAHVLWMFELYARESVSPREIARRLDARGVPTHYGAGWSFTSVRGILTNPCVAGRPAYRRRKYRLERATGRRLRRARPQAEQVVRADESLRIVPEELFQRVQEIIALRTRDATARGVEKIPGAEETHAFTGLLSCGVCGARCYGRKSANAKGTYRYYVCGARVRGGKNACSCPNVREDVLVGKLQRALECVWDGGGGSGGGGGGELLSELREAVSQRLGADRSDMDRAKGELRAIEGRIRAMTALITDPDVDASAKRSVSRQVGELEMQRDSALARVERLATGSAENAQAILEACVRAIDKARTSLVDTLPGTAVNRIVGEVFGPMEVRADGSVAALRRKHPGLDVGAVTLADSIRESVRIFACSLIAA